MKTLTNSGDFTGSHIRISNFGGTSKRLGNLNSAFEKADSHFYKAPKKFKNYLRIYIKYCFDFKDLKKNYSSRDTIPLKGLYPTKKNWSQRLGSKNGTRILRGCTLPKNLYPYRHSLTVLPNHQVFYNNFFSS